MLKTLQTRAQHAFPRALGRLSELVPLELLDHELQMGHHRFGPSGTGLGWEARSMGREFRARSRLVIVGMRVGQASTTRSKSRIRVADLYKILRQGLSRPLSSRRSRILSRCKPSMLGAVENEAGPSPKYVALGRVRLGGRHGEDSKRAAELVGPDNPRAAEIGSDQGEGRAVR